MQLFTKSDMDLATIRQNFAEGKMYVDPAYQRRKVWNQEDKVRLIETILLNYIVPPVFFWPAGRDPETGIASTHIVDGQQRISTIVEFLNDEYPLASKYLTTDEIKNKYGDMFFSDLDQGTREAVWDYKLSVVSIDASCSYETIKQMFYRLNLTDYSLNKQEKRNSLDSAFGEKCEALSTYDFWDKVRVFSATDAKRMRDVEFCCGIYILANEFIVNQTDDKIINSYYDDYSESFDDDKILINKIESAMESIEKLINKKTISFVSKKAQLYTLFSLFIKIEEENKEINDEFIMRFSRFVEVYSKFRNEYVFVSEDDKANRVYEQLKKYKLASSEGVNKITNRMIRFEILYELYEQDENPTETFMAILKFFDSQKTKNKFDLEKDDILDE
ncbi:DUF262 domain-containing protein [Butyrivibrio sp. AE3003]|uniref:DUF262 domain-containing protein n=1 Tax=Butyrivibrio sp. AE3003 TaxID=1496721 RepID=UPI00068D29AE|nr:DUF262 domain-containing protein [Butyrivibrio sp. AE3003]